MRVNKREGEYNYKTKETQVKVKINLDGNGFSNVKTGIGIFDHLLKNFSKFSLFDLTISVNGDLEVGEHHTIEDTGIALGEAIKIAIGNKEKINRIGFCYIPLDDTLVRVCIDVSGRAFLDFHMNKNLKFETIEFLRAFSNHSMITLHVDVLKGENEHHINEAIFKALGYSLRKAVKEEKRIKGVLSTK